MTTTFTASTIAKLIKCALYESLNNDTPNFEAERGSIIHAFINNVDENTIIEKGLEYRGNFQALKFTHDLKKYKQIAENVKKEFFNSFGGEIKENFQEISIENQYGNFELLGILDDVLITDKALFIFDWKTGRTRYNTFDVNDSVQSVIYVYLACEHFGFNKAVFSYVYIDDAGVEFVQSIERTNQECMEIIENWIEVIDLEQLNDFRNVNDNCQYCKKNLICPAVSRQVAIFETKDLINITKEDVKKAKAIIKLMDKIIDKYKETAPESDFYYKSMLYLDTSKLSIEEKLNLVKDKVSVTKEEAKQYDSSVIEEKKIKVMR